MADLSTIEVALALAMSSSIIVGVTLIAAAIDRWVKPKDGE